MFEGVKCIDHVWVPMPDGARLGARIWLPDDADAQPVPAILEYIPYRKDDYCAVRDSTTIAWFAGYGYACVRVDMRGSGSSDGVLYDEYSDLEIDDGVATINWIADQHWCDGNVGTIGISWGGITGLQLAQRNPKPLKTVIALGASEFRYYDDAGYYMGCMVGQTIGWAAIMFGYNTRPPDPAIVGSNWRTLWLERLNKCPHYLEHWLTHQREDDYWLRGTVGTNYDAIKIPVYALSGHADCWPNTVPRLLENLSVPKRGMQGPWSHRYPHLAIPGPAVGFLQDALRWFDRWLKGLHNGVMDEAVYQVFIQDSVRPKPYYETRPGRWIGEPAWPSPNISQRSYCLNHDGLSDFASSEQTMKICSPNTVGLHGGEYMPWFAFGRADELPDDQRLEDQGSLLFDTTPLSESLVILGDPEVELTLSCDQSVAMLAVRLCDVWPDEASTLITRGLLNLCQRNSKSDPEPLTPGKQYVVKIKLNHVGYTVPRGHKLRLAISTNYWPMAWPCPVAATVAIVTSVSQLKLPLRSNDATIGDITRFEAVQSGQAVKTVQLRDIQLHRSISVDPDTGAHVLEINADNGKVLFEHTKLEMASISLQRYKVKDSDPLSAKAEYRWEWEFARGSDWYVKTLTHTEFTCDRNYFYLTADSIAWENDREVFRKHWEKRFPRDHF